MLICSCNFITDKDIRDTVIKMIEEGSDVINAESVFERLGKEGKCFGCFPLSNLIIEKEKAQRN